jgi:hypothetical protein
LSPSQPTRSPKRPCALSIDIAYEICADLSSPGSVTLRTLFIRITVISGKLSGGGQLVVVNSVHKSRRLDRVVLNPGDRLGVSVVGTFYLDVSYLFERSIENNVCLDGIAFALQAGV